ncbi:MAG: phosphoadenosine phosphosulfate reductase family protein [Pseudomonadales bacterium]|nr:phosphoadenosine phosphosulfate reductase family protein [Pseudomonadales bacterium]MDB2409607.1 phosphoadenosine phosphosulfate reductase family protein [Pseudomonadales bacterium]MDG1938931.1 phosphoadenosine phosphosulfate reductase family protein [Pseudomonadales bacterium]MDG2035576.1 phosphoadenosine phosphosulfate reductase family protein [Pseudomonadales bacterium]
MDIEQINQQLRNASANEIVAWALSQGKKTIATTSFGKNAAVMLNVISQVDESVPTIWVDTGYNLRDTYVVADKLIKRIPLDYHVYSPLMTSERRNAVMGGIPTMDDEALHTEFTRQVKLEPFNRAIDEWAPEIWITGIRQQETEHRKTLDVLSWDARGILKVAPLFYWSDEQVEQYMKDNELLSCRHYFDPTKVQDGRECGLHTSA